MNKNNLQILLIIIVNLFVWGWLFIQVPSLIHTISFKKSIGEETTLTIGNPTSNPSQTAFIDFHRIRDPFSSIRVEKFPQVKKVSVLSNIKQKAQPLSNLAEKSSVEKDIPFESRFRLKSIAQVKGRLVATLEEVSRGDELTSWTGEVQGKSFIVSEGDTVLDEEVALIKNEYVTMKKNGKYYQIGFSGGHAATAAE